MGNLMPNSTTHNTVQGQPITTNSNLVVPAGTGVATTTYVNAPINTATGTATQQHYPFERYQSQVGTYGSGYAPNKSNVPKFGPPNRNYAEPVGSDHLQLQKQAQYSLQNLTTLLGRQPQYNVAGTGPVYKIKKLNATYQGQFDRSLPAGKGVAHFNNGGYYSGDFVAGDADGYGVYIYPNGSIYQGQFKQSQFNGHGTLTYVDQRMRYEGNFVNGIPNGHGTQMYGDGSKYVGEFHNGVKQGTGTYEWADGRKYVGNFSNGLMDGNGILYQGNQIAYNGTWSKGMKNGYGVFMTSDGTYAGNFNNDLLNGDGTFIYRNGNVYQGNFLNSMFNGRGRMYYPSNQVAEGEWVANHNKSLTNLRNDPTVAQKIAEIRKMHVLTGDQISRPASVYQQDSYRLHSNVENSSMYRDDSRREGERVMYDSSMSSSNRPSNIQTSGVQDARFVLQENY